MVALIKSCSPKSVFPSFHRECLVTGYMLSSAQNLEILLPASLAARCGQVSAGVCTFSGSGPEDTEHDTSTLFPLPSSLDTEVPMTSL